MPNSGDGVWILESGSALTGSSSRATLLVGVGGISSRPVGTILGRPSFPGPVGALLFDADLEGLRLVLRRLPHGQDFPPVLVMTHERWLRRYADFIDPPE